MLGYTSQSRQDLAIPLLALGYVPPFTTFGSKDCGKKDEATGTYPYEANHRLGTDLSSEISSKSRS
jgi:hypothetical protein